jgi:8-oxo-dGTP pyrophosphatase MutT (NUDIX family)
MQEKSCGAIVENKGKYLLLHYTSGHWDFPKGHVEEGETEKETAIRELKEETGITKIEIMPNFRETFSYYFSVHKQTKKKEVVFFLMRTPQEKVTLSHEHKGFEWLEYNDAIERLTFKNAKFLLKKANELLNNLSKK